MQYRRLVAGLNDKGMLIPADANPLDYVGDFNKDHYISTFKYNEEHKHIFDTTGTIAGIVDLYSNKLWFDFDSEVEPEQARQDAATLVKRLIDQKIAAKEDILMAFSGQKGFAIEVNLTQDLNPKQVKNLAFSLAKDLPTFDVKVYNASRIMRVITTKHQKTGLYKTPLTYSQLSTMNLDGIMELAKNPPEYNEQEFRWSPVTISLPKEEAPKEAKLVDRKFDVNEIDFSHKIKGWSNCKWALLNGYQVQQNDRHEKLLAIISQSKALHNTKNQAYYNAKMADEYGVTIYGGVKSTKEDLWMIVESVYADSWKGGTYSCKDGKSEWLTDICNSLGVNKCKHAEDLPIVRVEEVFGLFKNYAENFEKNVIKTGIEQLDDKCKFMVGTSNGILAPPGVGKTSLSLGMLNYNSSQNIDSVFFSYDMFHSMVYLRLVQKHTGYNQDKIFNIFKTDKKESQRIFDLINEQYKNVHFCFKSGQNADEIQETIIETEQKIGKKIKLAMVDYNELVITNVSDPTQSSAVVAQRLRQIANDTETCVVTLLQPSKLFSNPSDEITSYTGAKGSGAIAQALSLMISLSRPGFSPRNPENDRFFTINALKNRQGGLFTIDLGWDGPTGKIFSLDNFALQELKEIRDRLAMEKSNKGDLGF